MRIITAKQFRLLLEIDQAESWVTGIRRRESGGGTAGTIRIARKRSAAYRRCRKQER